MILGKHLKPLLVFIAVLTMVELIVFVGSYKYMANKMYAHLEDTVESEGADLSLLCSTVGCSYIAGPSGVYKKTDGCPLHSIDKHAVVDIGDDEPVYTDILNASTVFTLNIDGSTYQILRDEKEYIVDNGTGYLIVMLIMSGLLTLMYARMAQQDRATQNLEHTKKMSLAEGNQQQIISESAHHQMMLPVALIKTTLSEVVRMAHRCIKRPGIVCKPGSIPACHKCVFNTNSDDINNLANHMNKIEGAIEQLEGVLHTMSEAKQHKYSNGNKHVLALAQNAADTLRMLDIAKFDIVIAGEDALAKVKVDGIANGNMVTIISNHITNSIEAKASKIVLQGVASKNSNSVYLYITDNGCGVHRRHIDRIFENGVTTKDMDGKTLVHRTWWKRIFRVTPKIASATPRGLGLYDSEMMLKQAGGKLEMVNTSSHGTQFRLTIPTKEYVCSKD